MNKLLLIQKLSKKNLITGYKSLISKNTNDNKYKLFILTTAITRRTLHNISFNNYKKFIPTNIPILWIINLDFVKFDDITDNAELELEKTKNNIINMFIEFENIDFKFFVNEKGNFNKAVRTLTEYTSITLTDKCNGILYLEDDWFSIEDFDLKTSLNLNIDIIKLYDDHDPRKKASFQPLLIKPYIWYLMFYKQLKANKDELKDPEKICQITKEITDYNMSFIINNKFKDIGRNEELNDDNMIRGWYQKLKSSQENISLSYIYIDKLLLSIIYILSENKKIQDKHLEEKIISYLKNIFMSEIINKIHNKYKSNKDNYYKHYTQFAQFNGTKETNLKLVYYNIDKLIETGA